MLNRESNPLPCAKLADATLCSLHQCPGYGYTSQCHRTYAAAETSGKTVKVVSVFNELIIMPWTRMGEWRYRFTVLDLGTRWRWVVNFTPRLLYPPKKSPRYPWIQAEVPSSLTIVHIFTRMSDYRRGFGSDIGFIDHFNTQLVITLNYSAIAEFHTLQNHAKAFPARSSFTGSCLVTASNNDYSSACGLKSSLNCVSFPAELFLLELSSL
jgi:hypothetical protein